MISKIQMDAFRLSLLAAEYFHNLRNNKSCFLGYCGFGFDLQGKPNFQASEQCFSFVA